MHDGIPAYVKEAFRHGILSVNHRSEAFMDISRRCVTLLKEKLNIPEDYTVFYTTSATECWEIIAQSLPTGVSHHVYNGAFGEKWYTYTQRLRKNVVAHSFGREEVPDPANLRLDGDEGIICITQNETSNGTQVNGGVIGAIHQNNPNAIIAVDATSSMAGIELNFSSADIWFASVQKCFGLPAGLGLMVCSPRAIESVKTIGEADHYNSLVFMNEMMAKWQTPFTPNVLSIYLLMKVMESSKPIAEVHGKTFRRYKRWLAFLDDCRSIRHLVANHAAHSWTVIPVTADEPSVTSIKATARDQGFLLGEGYGKLKPSTFRIANFPAIRNSEIRKLQVFLKNY